jgi:hypothetical protein
LTERLEQGREVDSGAVVCISDDSGVLVAGNWDGSSRRIRLSAITVREERMTSDKVTWIHVVVVAVIAESGIQGVKIFATCPQRVKD